MSDLEKLKAWLQTYPHWQEQILVDVTQAVPGGIGLYPKGLQELSRREDVAGNLVIRFRWSFSLHRIAVCGQDSAQWLMAFQQWVFNQCRQGLAPRFGDVPGQEQIRACEGSLISRKQGGQTGYTVLLTADFSKIYRGE